MKTFGLLLLLSLGVFTWSTSQNFTRDLGLDEGYSLLYSSASPGLYENKTLNSPTYLQDIKLKAPLSLSHFNQISHRLANSGETHPPFYYWMLSSFLTLKYSLWTARALSLLFALLTLVLLFKLSHKLYKLPDSLLAPLFLLSSYHFIQVSTQARMHGATLFLTSLTFFIFYQIMEKEEKSNNIQFVVLGSILSIGLLNSFLFLHIVGAAITLLLFKRPLKKVALVIFPIVITQLLYLSTTGIAQLRRVPYGEFSFSGLFKGPAAPFYKGPLTFTEQVSSIPFHLTPLSSLGHFHPNLTISLILAFIILLVWTERRIKKKWILLLTLLPCGSVLIFDFLTQSFISHWGESRAVNFLLPGLSLVVLSVYSKITYVKLKQACASAFIIVVLAHNIKLSQLRNAELGASFQQTVEQLKNKHSPDNFVFIKDHQAQNAPKMIEKIYILKAWVHFPKKQKAIFLRSNRPYSLPSEEESVVVMKYQHKSEESFYQTRLNENLRDQLSSRGDPAIPVPLLWSVYHVGDH